LDVYVKFRILVSGESFWIEVFNYRLRFRFLIKNFRVLSLKFEILKSFRLRFRF
jgi:hypothetical protein